MLNISFGEIVVVAVVGLIVIGPRRLPETARFVGHLVARARRQVADVKADIRREMDLEDLKSIQREYESAARDIGGSFKKSARDMRDAADSARADFDSSPSSSENAKENADADANAIASPAAPWPSPSNAAADKKNDGDAARATSAKSAGE